MCADCNTARLDISIACIILTSPSAPFGVSRPPFSFFHDALFSSVTTVRSSLPLYDCPLEHPEMIFLGPSDSAEHIPRLRVRLKCTCASYPRGSNVSISILDSFVSKSFHLRDLSFIVLENKARISKTTPSKQIETSGYIYSRTIPACN